MADLKQQMPSWLKMLERLWNEPPVDRQPILAGIKRRGGLIVAHLRLEPLARCHIWRIRDDRVEPSLLKSLEQIRLHEADTLRRAQRTRILLRNCQCSSRNIRRRHA